MKLLKKILVFFIILVVVLLVGRNIIVKSVLQTAVPLVTGLGLKVEKLNIGIFDTKLHIVGLKMTNPKGFEEKVMLDLPEVLVDYNLGDIIGGKIHTEEIIFNLQEFNVVRSGEGKLNLDALKVVQEGKAKEEKKPLKLQIDRFELKFGKVQFINYEKNTAEPSVQTIELNLDEEYKDITNPQVIVAIIMQKVITNAALNKITGFDLGGISGAMGNVVGNMDDLAAGALGSAKELTDGALKSAGDLTGGVMEGVGGISGDAAEKANEAVKEASEALQGLTGKLKLPFGGEKEE
jgi:hypothetical protein